MWPKGLVGGQYRPLSDDRIGRIHETSLRVLEEVGVDVKLEEARHVFRSGGAEVDDESCRVRIKPHLVERALENAPTTLRLCGREEAHDVVAEGRRTYFGTGGAATQVIDLETGKVRPSRLQDIADLARVAEELPNIHFFVRPCAARDVDAKDLAINEFYAALANTNRHVVSAAYTPEGAEKVAEMGKILAGSEEALLERPLLSFIVSLINSPLTFDGTAARTLIAVARTNLPVTLSAAPMAGSTAPVTLAGTLVQLHAEELAGIVFTQLINPGVPVIYGGIPSMADMRRLSYIGGAVEYGMMNAAIAQMSRYIDVPVYNSAGVTESKEPDVQAVYEKSFAILQCALAGSNCVHHAAGMLESLLTVSAEQMVIDDEIIAMARRAIRGIEVTGDRLAFDAIQAVGPGGNYLTQEHTMRYLRGEFLEPALADRNMRETWEQTGMKGIREKANERARNILKEANTRPPCIPDEADTRIREQFNILLER